MHDDDWVIIVVAVLVLLALTAVVPFVPIGVLVGTLVFALLRPLGIHWGWPLAAALVLVVVLALRWEETSASLIAFRHDLLPRGSLLEADWHAFETHWPFLLWCSAPVGLAVAGLLGLWEWLRDSGRGGRGPGGPPSGSAGVTIVQRAYGHTVIQHGIEHDQR